MVRGINLRVMSVWSILKALIIASAFLGFCYNVYSNLTVYLQGHTVVEVNQFKDPPARFPPLVICPFPAFDSVQLIRLGLNTTTDAFSELEYNIENLVGIDRTLTGRELVEKAALKVHDLVKEVKIGEYFYESYTGNNATSLLWQRSFTPLGPCLTFTAPWDASLYSHHLTVKFHEKPLYSGLYQNDNLGHLKQCNRSQENDFVSCYCKNDSACKNQSRDLVHIIFAFLPSSYITYNIHILDLEKPIYHDANPYVLHPYQVVSDDLDPNDYDPNECLRRIFLRHGQRRANCIPLYEDSLKYSIESLCVTQKQHYESTVPYFTQRSNILLNTSNICKSKQVELRWKIERNTKRSKSKVTELELNFILKSSTTKRFHKKSAYPLGKLFEDTGGSIGLILGVSLLDVLIYVSKKILFCKEKHSLQKDSFTLQVKELFLLSAVLIVSVPFCVHCGIMLQRYSTISDVSSISLDEAYHEYNLSNNDPLSVELALFALAASKPLGCQLIDFSSEEKCFFHCVIDRPNFPVFSLNNDDLFNCFEHQLVMPKMTYIVPEHSIFSPPFMSKIQSCEKDCKIFNSSDYHRNIGFSVSTKPGFSFIEIICSFGGIVGLYFGFSLIGLVNQIRRKIFFRVSRCPFRKPSFLFLKVLIVIGCLLLSAFQLNRYLFDHPLYTTYSSKRLRFTELPAITLCIWPPFNVGKLFTLSDLEKVISPGTEVHPSRRTYDVTHFLQSLQNTSHFKSPDQRYIWQNSSWNMGDSFTSNFQMSVQKLNTNSILNTCYSLKIHETPRAKYFHLRWQTMANELNDDSSVLVYIHNPLDLPPLYLGIRDTSSTNDPELNRIIKWEGISGKNIKVGQCLHQCFDEALLEQMQCLLPWMKMQQGVKECNMTHFGKFLSKLMQLSPSDGPIMERLLGGEVADQCKKHCRSGRMFYYGLRFDAEERVESAFGFRIKGQYVREGLKKYNLSIKISANIYEEFIDIDGYPFSLFISDVGGIIGMTLGTSLLTVLLKFIKHISKK